MSTSTDPDAPLWSLVESSSKAIKYSDFGWNEPAWAPNSRFNFARYGEPPFSDTTVSPTNVPGRSGVFYDFTGTRIVVEGTLDNSPDDSSWSMTCQVDGQDVMVVQDIYNRRANHVAFCDADGLSPDGVHSLNFTIHVRRTVNFGPQVYFDLLKIAPSPSTDLENALVHIRHSARMNKYDDSWLSTDAGHYTATTGSKVVVEFNGTQLRWYGFYDPTIPGSREGASATWQLDNIPAVRFTIPSISSSPESSQIGVPFFITPELIPGMHRLEVTYAPQVGARTGRPLSLHHLVIQNAPLPSAISVPPTSTPSNGISPGNSSSIATGSGEGLSKTATIAIAVNVSIAALVLIGLSVFLWHRRRRQCRAKSKEAQAPTPFESNPQSPISAPDRKALSSADSSASTVESKGTPIEDIPVRRGSLHIRSWNDDAEGPPPYHPGRT
ncbi:hypothetical protein CVT24_004838 [Panaeolus cyanescens]|uniref:Uncharacterized protein n=1 Tax=Panaeolus cyanescens TaxID=181874 RepID=A0A409W200_9AGAR|nr:hypothetical protein CVT24_004838 [Panaeolus cyanescens]